ncbi:MAG: lptA [Rhizobacter sp.]|nr:lptA [Rhizobacter sp.]
MPFMTKTLQSIPRIASAVAALITAVTTLAVSTTVQAERADRSKPLEIQADDGGGYNFLKQRGTFNKNVVATKGSMVLRSDSLEVWETPEGYQQGIATGTSAKPATFSQKRDGIDESIQGQAQRIEYDGRTDTYKLTSGAVVRRMRGGTVADEVTGNVITYDNTTEIFNVNNGTAPAGSSAAASQPRGRVRVTLTPPPEPAASGAEQGLPLRPSGELKSGSTSAPSERPASGASGAGVSP